MSVLYWLGRVTGVTHRDYEELVSAEGMLVETKADPKSGMPICRTRCSLLARLIPSILMLILRSLSLLSLSLVLVVMI